MQLGLGQATPCDGLRVAGDTASPALSSGAGWGRGLGVHGGHPGSPRITLDLKPSQCGAQLGESTVNSSAAAGFSSPVPSRLLTQGGQSGVGTKLNRCRRLTSRPILLFT